MQHDWAAAFDTLCTTQGTARGVARALGIPPGTMSAAVAREQALPGRGRLAAWTGGITPPPPAVVLCPGCAARLVLEVTRG